MVADNYGDTTTAVASIQFYGFGKWTTEIALLHIIVYVFYHIELKLLQWFEELGLPQYIKPFAEKAGLVCIISVSYSFRVTINWVS